MSSRSTALRVLALALLGGSVLPVGGSPARAAAPDVVVGLIDTGVNAAHQEFAPGQLVGFWDFSRDQGKHLPGPGQAFDPAAAPFDPIGHGTMTSSMAVGLNVVPEKTASFAPGHKFAMAKVFAAGGATGGGQLLGDIAAAIRWEVDTVHVSVISMSIGTVVPLPGQVGINPIYAAIDYARSKGVLTFVSNGNGLANTGAAPSDGATSSYSESTNVIAVGPTGLIESFANSQNPILVAAYKATGASYTDNTGYIAQKGTSFSTPLVAGFAARLISEAAANGRSFTADSLTQLLKWSARDTTMPPSSEGYGIIDADQLPAALAHAASGTLPAAPPALNTLWVEQVAGTIRGANRVDLP
jgi:hypothetical protein